MSLIDAQAYHYRVIQDLDHDQYLAQVYEFRGLSYVAPTKAEALKGLQAMVAEVLADMASAGEWPPFPRNPLD